MAPETTALDPQTEANVNDWLNGPYDEESKAQIRKWLKEDPKQIEDAFYRKLEFGTGGLRGIMGVGSNRMNLYTVRAATQGLANYINKQTEVPGPHAVLIGYDSRHNSELFAQESAKVLAANGIHCFLFAHLRPVPLVSFGCRFKKCTAAVMVTASHNPKEYNGYKVYWKDGAQVLPPHDEGIIREVNAVADPSLVKETKDIALDHPLIERVEEEIDKAYLQAMSTLQHYPEETKAKGKELLVVYTPLYGAGITIVPHILESWGFNQPILVQEQSIPNGDFPTTPYPNPEEPAALKLGIDLLTEKKADILLATDPDADRLGVVAMHEEKPVIFNGNEIACLCLKHVCEALTATKKMPERAAFIKTIVTSELFKEIAKSYGKPCFDVLTGFKYIGQLITQWENSKDGYQYIYGGEESFGTMLGSYTRDKDAEIACALVSEAALHLKLQGKTLRDLLWQIYEEHGLFREKLVSLVFEGKEGVDKIAKMMEQARKNPPQEFNGVPVVAVDDYQLRRRTDFVTHKQQSLTLPLSNVLVFWLKDRSRLVVRPSGTEPKIKLYGEVYAGKVTKEGMQAAIAAADQRVADLLETLKKAL